MVKNVKLVKVQGKNEGKREGVIRTRYLRDDKPPTPKGEDVGALIEQPPTPKGEDVGALPSSPLGVGGCRALVGSKKKRLDTGCIKALFFG